jgi:hypothetical protein
MSNLTLQDDWEIAVVLNPRPLVIPIQKDAVTFDVLGDHFEDVGLGYHNGFYDFLRSRTGAVIGTRFLPCADAEVALKAVAESEGISRAKDGKLPLLLIFWGPHRDFDPEAPCDQSFGNNYIYRSKQSGKLAIGFSIDVLTPEERVSVKQMAIT